MTTSIATQQASTRSAADRPALTLAEALRALGDRIERWSASYYGTGIGDELEALPPNRRVEAALRWHDRHGRLV